MIRVKILYFVLLAEILLLNVMYLRFWPLWLLIIAIAIPFFLKVCQLITARDLKIELICPKDTINKGETAKVYFNISSLRTLIVNKLVINYRYKFSYEEIYHKDVCEVCLFGKNMHSLSVEPLCEHIGTLEIIIDKIVLYDMMYLTHKKIKSDIANIKTYIVPKFFENIGVPNISKVGKFTDSDTFSDKKPGDDPSEVFDIRNFKDGDRLNSVHWKLTGKTGNIMVKEFSLPLNNSDYIVFGSKKKDKVNTDFMYEGLLSLVYLMLEHERTATVCYPNDKSWGEINIAGYEDVDTFLKCLLDSNVTSRDIDEFSDSKSNMVSNGNCYLITDTINDTSEYKDIASILTVNSNIESPRIIKLKDWILYE